MRSKKNKKRMSAKEQESNIQNLQKKLNYICEMNNNLKVPSENEPSSFFLRMKRKFDGNRGTAAIFMLFLNIGSRYINLNLTTTQEYYIRKMLIPEILVFAISWMGSRDVLIAFGITTAYAIISRFMLNENSNFCVFKERMKDIKQLIDTNNDNKISDNEIQQAVKILSSKIENNKGNTNAKEVNNSLSITSKDTEISNNELNDENIDKEGSEELDDTTTTNQTPIDPNEPQEFLNTIKNNGRNHIYAFNLNASNIPTFEGLQNSTKITSFPSTQV